MKLYYSPGACSLASHITLIEAGVPFTAEKVNLKDKVTEGGADFWKVSPRGAVPVLDLGADGVLTEGVAIMQYVMDSAKPGHLPSLGTLGRARLVEMLNYISTEVHKTYSPFFRPMADEAKAAQMQLLDARLKVIEDKLADGRAFLTGADFSRRMPISSPSPTGRGWWGTICRSSRRSRRCGPRSPRARRCRGR